MSEADTSGPPARRPAQELQPAQDLRPALLSGEPVALQVAVSGQEIAAYLDRFAARTSRESVELIKRRKHSAVLSVVLGPYDEREGRPPTRRAAFGRWRTTDLHLEWEPASTGSVLRASFKVAPASRPSRLAYLTHFAPLLFGLGAMLFSLQSGSSGALLVFLVGLGLCINPAYQLLAVSKRTDRKILSGVLSSMLDQLGSEADPYRGLGPGEGD